MFATQAWQAGGSGGIDDAFVRPFDSRIGAEIMGAGKFGHPGWHEDPDWTGAWGPNPPFHTPVIILTHHTRPSTVIRDFLASGLIDHMHTVVVPVPLGHGVRLWDGLEGIENHYRIEAAASPSGVTHVTFTRAGA
jgi:hypothetical protein